MFTDMRRAGSERRPRTTDAPLYSAAIASTTGANDNGDADILGLSPADACEANTEKLIRFDPSATKLLFIKFGAVLKL